MKFIGRLPIAPLLLSLYAVLALLANNIDQISGIQALRSLALSLMVAGAAVGLFMLVFRNWHRATLAASLLVLLFFSVSGLLGEECGS